MQWNDVPRVGQPVRFRDGQRGTVLEIDHRHRLIHIELATGWVDVVPPEDLDAGED